MSCGDPMGDLMDCGDAMGCGDLNERRQSHGWRWRSHGIPMGGVVPMGGGRAMRCGDRIGCSDAMGGGDPLGGGDPMGQGIYAARVEPAEQVNMWSAWS